MLNRLSDPQSLLKFAHYHILDSKILGKGFNSLVYEGVNIISGQHVAIKKINLTDQIQHKLALNQLSCLKQMSHPQILRYHFDFQTKNTIYIVTELCQETLFSRLIRHKKFPEREAVEIFIKIMAGYQEIRRKGYLHRDLKPQNIFLRLGEIRIGDFGFCIQAKYSEIKQGFNVGTPLYMSPQVIQQNIYSQKSDIWSLGILLYEMLHGKVPFSSKKEKDLISQMKLSSIRFDCHPGLQNILRNTLNVNKEKRFSLKELQSALGKYLFDEKNVEKLQKLSDQERKIANELQYMKLMEYIQLISSKCKKNKGDPRINYLFQYTIRMRLKFMETLESASPLKDGLLKTEVSEMKLKHSQALSLPEGLGETDRLRFLNANESDFNYFTLWYIQAQLKEILRQMFHGLKAIDSEEKVAKNQDHLRLTDFLLTAYVLNRMLIESEDCMQQFSDIFQFSIILHRPQRFNVQVCRSIQQKAQELRII